MTKTNKLRADTANAIYDVLENGRSLRDVLPAYQQNHAPKDQAWLQEMCFGVLRQLPLLQHWLREMLDKPLKSKAKVIEHLLMLGFYQLQFSRVSQHAAVAETVAAAPALKNQHLKGLVNAILREFVRRDMGQQIPDVPHVKAGMPKWLFKRVQQHYGDMAADIFAEMHQRGPMWLRVNQAKTSVSAYTAQLQAAGIDFEHSASHPDAILLASPMPVETLPGFDAGLFAVQDGAAQLAAQLLAAKPGERVLDACAAPGGKTCHIIETQPDLASCVALDVDAARLQRVTENLQRLGHQAQLVAADAADINTWWDGQYFDRILLDAPCSATGVIRRHPDIKWLRKSADIQQLQQLQRTILQALWQTLKPGGTLLYATCSILPDENREQIAWFLQQQPDAKLDGIVDGESDTAPGRQILPGEENMDGFYYARLIKAAQQ